MLRSRSLGCLSSRLRSPGSGRHKAALPRPPQPCCPAPSPRHPSRGTAPGLGGCPLLLRACLRGLSRRDRSGNLPPLSPPRAPTLRPSSASPWSQFLGELGLCRRAEDSLAVRNSGAPTGPCKQVNAVWGAGVRPEAGGRLRDPGALPMTWAEAGNASLGSAARDADWAARARGGRAAGVFRRGGCLPRRGARLVWGVRWKVSAVWRGCAEAHTLAPSSSSPSAFGAPEAA